MEITVAGGDLYRIAAGRLGDARQWWRLAQTSGLNDPVLSGLVTLTVPPPDPTLIDGLPPA